MVAATKVGGGGDGPGGAQDWCTELLCYGVGGTMCLVVMQWLSSGVACESETKAMMLLVN